MMHQDGQSRTARVCTVMLVCICWASRLNAQAPPAPNTFFTEPTADWQSTDPQALPDEYEEPPFYQPAIELEPRPATPTGPPRDLAALMRPRFSLRGNEVAKVDGIATAAYAVSVTQPVYPIFGPPPPMINAGYEFTQFESPAALDIPDRLHQFSLGASWMRRLTDAWMLRFTLGAAFASDLNHTGSDAWQIRGGAFAIYRPSEQWSFAVGAMATGRDDLPVLPAAGLIWQPSEYFVVNLMMPRPKISLLVLDTGTRHHWLYVGGGISGGTWAFERNNGAGDRISYREWRAVIGWEAKNPQAPGTFRPGGFRWNVEAGYVFGRNFEFDSGASDVSISNAFIIAAGVSF